MKVQFLEKGDFETGLYVICVDGKGMVKKAFSTKMESWLPFACGKFLTAKGTAYVFNEKTKRLLGYVRKDPNLGLSDLATLKELEPEELYIEQVFSRA